MLALCSFVLAVSGRSCIIGLENKPTAEGDSLVERLCAPNREHFHHFTPPDNATACENVSLTRSSSR
uniref:Putative secreted protein n=1 Tax=Anopheles darlingi TaxID=43151 RepID=A0A2M4DQT4_ANODA